jgi:hypothetical protein
MQTLLPARIRLTGNIPDPTGPLLAGGAGDPAAASKALRAALTTAIVDATEVERLAELVRTVGASATDTGDQAELETVSAAKGCDVQAINRAEAGNLQLSPQQDSWVRNARPSEGAQAIDRAEAEYLQLSPQQDSWSRNSSTSENMQAIDMAEAENLQLSPQQDSWIHNASTSEIYSVHELWTDSGLATVGAPVVERAETSRLIESGVATHTILELHDRLGSFIKR